MSKGDTYIVERTTIRLGGCSLSVAPLLMCGLPQFQSGLPQRAGFRNLGTGSRIFRSSKQIYSDYGKIG